VDALITLALREADNSVKLMILSKLQTEILFAHPEILQSAVLDLLRVLSSADPSVRRICLEIVAASATSRVALEIVQFLKKEVGKAAGDDSEYRQNVLDALYKCSMSFSEVGTEVMSAYLELIKNGFINESLVSYMKYTETSFNYILIPLFLV
jgi:vesicle coat complex subunit